MREMVQGNKGIMEMNHYDKFLHKIQQAKMK